MFSTQYDSIGCCGDRAKFLIYRFWWSCCFAVVAASSFDADYSAIVVLVMIVFFSLSLLLRCRRTEHINKNENFWFIIIVFRFMFNVCLFVHMLRESSPSVKKWLLKARVFLPKSDTFLCRILCCMYAIHVYSDEQNSGFDWNSLSIFFKSTFCPIDSGHFKWLWLTKRDQLYTTKSIWFNFCILSCVLYIHSYIELSECNLKWNPFLSRNSLFSI